MWAPNIGDLSRRHRVYALDTMGQPGKSVPSEPTGSAADYVRWLTATLDALRLDRVDLLGMSFGGWLALNYAAAVPGRVRKLVLLSPGGILPLSKQLGVRGLLMMLLPTRSMVSSLMRWAGMRDAPGESDDWRLIDLMYLGIKYFRMPQETLRVTANPLSDNQLRALHTPVLVLIGEDEVLYDAAAAMARASRLVPDFQGDLVPDCRHDMCASQSRTVDARVLEFLEKP
jgi:pimeloyl-ACP methyl ester carboxylesterase